MAEGDVYTGMMCMSLWSNNRSCDGVVIASEYMSVWVLYSIIYHSVCRYGIYSVYSMYRTVQCIVYVLYVIVYISVCQICDDVWLNEARHIWHIDRVTEQWQNLEQVSIWFSASVPDQKATCYPLLSVAISCYPVSVRFLCVCFLLSGA